MDDFFQYGYKLNNPTSNGITWFKKTSNMEPAYNYVRGFPANTGFGKYYGNPNDISKGIFFVKDFTSGEFVRAYFNPLYMPLAVFNEGNNSIACVAHNEYVKICNNNMMSCGCTIQGMPITIGKRVNGLNRYVYGFQVIVEPNSNPFITINYICNNPVRNKGKSYIVKRCIGQKNKKEFDWLEKPAEIDDADFLNSEKQLPPIVYDFVIRLISTNVKKLYGITIENKNLKDNQNFISAIYAYPYDYNFYFLRSEIPEIDTVDRMNPKCFELLCQKLGFNSWRTFRRLYNEDYNNFLVVKNARDMGFRDINIFNKILMDKKIKNIFINHEDPFLDLDDLFDFCEENQEIENAQSEELESIERLLRNQNRYNPNFSDTPFYKYFCNIITVKGEKYAWNLIKKSTAQYIKENAYDFNDMFDAIYIYENFKKYFSEDEKNKILKEGFTVYNHNMLSKIITSQHDVIFAKVYGTTFDYSDEEKKLEGVIDGYEFKLVENPLKLSNLGKTLHNCVGSYIERVKKRNCLIVYATKDGMDRICIEVRGRLIQQGRGDRNSSLKDNDLAVFNKWKAEKRLVFRGNHF